ncbi:general transcription factor IIF subunit 1-like [Antedon mediterranea]|uniref:general transcription factor IIF subunit 1-like n=1 Tax=Antedon mediterranea TaxID=105859 RepID=UPI003AF709B8
MNVQQRPGISRSANAPPAQQDFKEYVVRVQRNADKMYSVMKFNSGDRVDFTKWKKGVMLRENNLGKFKDQNDMPKFGEGSEYGRERREEARKKKYGIISKKYKEEDQPWILKQHEKGGKKYKGTKEGGINDNASHYIFTQMADGSFCASPVKSWYKFTPMVQYKFLNDEEAEEEFGRRDKTLNFFSVMVKKRIKQDGSLEDEQKEEKSKAPRKKDSLTITEDDEYLGFLSDDDDDSDDDSDDTERKQAKEKKAKKKAKNSKKKYRVKKKDWGEEAGEESDVDDYDDQEKDYLSEKSSDEEETVEQRKDEERGLDEEIEEINVSSEEEVEEEEIKEPEVEDAENKDKEDKSKEDGSSASGSDSDDSDIDDSKIQSAVFMQNKTQVKKTSGKSSKSSSRNSSRPGTPLTADNTTTTLSQVAGRLQDKGVSNKRQGDAGSSSQSQTPGPPSKKPRTESPMPLKGQPGEVRITEDVVRRYLMRKPMTTKDLLHKLNPKKTGMSPTDIVKRLTEVMLKLGPKKEVIKDKVYWSIKST